MCLPGNQTPAPPIAMKCFLCEAGYHQYTKIAIHAFPHKRTIRIIESSIWPAALYGIEMNAGYESMLRILQGAVANTIGPHSVRRSQIGTFEIQQCSKDLDPEVVQLVKRITLFRRQLAKLPDLVEKVRTIVRKYDTEREKERPKLNLDDKSI